jgi:hypothetical protein
LLFREDAVVRDEVVAAGCPDACEEFETTRLPVAGLAAGCFALVAAVGETVVLGEVVESACAGASAGQLKTHR